MKRGTQELYLMSENATSNQVGLALTLAHAEAYNAESEAQRIVKAMLCNIARTLSGLSVEQADAMREEYCQKYPKAKNETNKAKSSNRVDKYGGEVVWPGDMVPPLVRQFNEAADLTFKLRKLGVIDKDTPISANYDDVKRRHAERYADR